MEKNIAFNIPTYKDSDGYKYWVPLLEYFLAKANKIEIHCWNDEVETIKELTALHNGVLQVVIQDNLTIFTGNKTRGLTDYLLNNYTDKNEKIKWFTINVNQDEDSVIHSGHWGSEFFVPNVLEEEIELIKSLTPPDTIFHHF
ncbi:hypothetical protein [Falsibacillus albus]|uniref:Uncharacterized protein n=1 Tax=Falsibacillus albus TaxID=2478915 RepID=A0A3L7JWB1_9BACI|nr:hypothetical protein [Falsibacillus albus]RLQ95148.1 hypothetical protein D9X91_11670 [Falsibacillus albus]